MKKTQIKEFMKIYMEKWRLFADDIFEREFEKFTNPGKPINFRKTKSCFNCENVLYDHETGWTTFVCGKNKRFKLGPDAWKFICDEYEKL